MKKGLLLGTALIILLSGCSSRLAYNNLDWLVYWYLDDYVELDNSQEAIFDEHLKAWLAWHKSEELTRYYAHLSELKQDVETNNLSKAVVIHHLDQANQHWNRIRDKVSPTLANMARTLDEDQVIYLFAAIEKENQKDRDELEEIAGRSDSEARKKRIETIEETIEERIGRLTPEQEQIVDDYSDEFMSTFAQWVEYRETIQQAARKLFITRDTNSTFESDLLLLMDEPDSYRTIDYIAAREHNRERWASMITEIGASLTPKQKTHLLDNVSDLMEDVERFMK